MDGVRISAGPRPAHRGIPVQIAFRREPGQKGAPGVYPRTPLGNRRQPLRFYWWFCGLLSRCTRFPLPLTVSTWNSQVPQIAQFGLPV